MKKTYIKPSAAAERIQIREAISCTTSVTGIDGYDSTTGVYTIGGIAFFMSTNSLCEYTEENASDLCYHDPVDFSIYFS